MQSISRSPSHAPTPTPPLSLCSSLLLQVPLRQSLEAIDSDSQSAIRDAVEAKTAKDEAETERGRNNGSNRLISCFYSLTPPIMVGLVLI